MGASSINFHVGLLLCGFLYHSGHQVRCGDILIAGLLPGCLMMFTGIVLMYFGIENRSVWIVALSALDAGFGFAGALKVLIDWIEGKGK